MFNSAEHCRSVARIRRGSVNAGRLSVDWPGRGSKRREKRTAGNGLKIENAAIIYFANIQVRLPRRPVPRLEHFDARSPSVSLFCFSPRSTPSRRGSDASYLPKMLPIDSTNRVSLGNHWFGLILTLSLTQWSLGGWTSKFLRTIIICKTTEYKCLTV